LENDHVALLDQLYSMPAKVLESDTAKSKKYLKPFWVLSFYLQDIRPFLPF
jgi:hypothetical protein